MNLYLVEFPPNTEGQDTAHLPANEIMDIIYHSILTMWKIKMIEQGLNYASCTIKEMSDFFETKVENLEPKEKKKKHQQLPINRRKTPRKENRKTPTPML